MDWVILLQMSKLRPQAFEWHAWGPLLVNGRTRMRTDVSLPLCSRPHCRDSLLSSIGTHSNLSNHCCQRVSVLLFTLRVKCCSLGRHLAISHVAVTSQRSLASHLKSFTSLLKLDQLHFLLGDSSSRLKPSSFWLSSFLEFSLQLALPLSGPSPILLTRNWFFSLSCFSPNLESFKLSFVGTPNPRPNPPLAWFQIPSA